MHSFLQILFAILLGVAGWFFQRNMRRIVRVILLGRPEKIGTNTATRLKNMLLLAFGQKKMFKNPWVAFLHLLVYVGFVIINIEVLEILLDGLLGTHRLFAPALGGFYTFLINAFEILALGVLVACVIFLLRRNLVKVKRLASSDLSGWPRSDANYILTAEIILMSAFLCMNAADSLLQARGESHYSQVLTGPFVVSQQIALFLNSLSTQALVVLERTCWWVHIVGILIFLNYLPYSKHLHILFAFPNTWFARPEALGTMTNMPEIQKEVALAMGVDISTNPVLSNLPDEPPTKFGAQDLNDLSWRNLLDAYSCTECGRCSAACPANLTGKVLSPRLIMMKTRDRCEEVIKNDFVINENYLLHKYITVEELRACTTCNACVDACPVMISPLDIILKLRRYLILDESNSPTEWNAMFGNIENNFAPWKFSPDERAAWISEK